MVASLHFLIKLQKTPANAIISSATTTGTTANSDSDICVVALGSDNVGTGGCDDSAYWLPKYINNKDGAPPPSTSSYRTINTQPA